jgi:hypothetical protein
MSTALRLATRLGTWMRTFCVRRTFGARDGFGFARRLPLGSRCQALMLSLSVIAVVGAAPAERAAGESVEMEAALPPFLVEGQTGRPLRWNYLQLPSLELLTTCPPSVAREFAEMYVRQEQLIELLVPRRYLKPSATPMVTLLIDAATSKRITDDTMAKALHERTPRNASRRGRAEVMPNLRLTDRDSAVVLSLLRENTPDEVTFSLTPSWLAFRLERHTPTLPRWLVAGLVGLYEECLFFQERVEVQPANWRSAEEVSALRLDSDWPRDVQPLASLFGSFPPSTATSARKAWAEQATLFVRWALLANNGKRTEAFWRFVDRCLEGPPAEAVFRECFGLGFSDARDQLSDYLLTAVQETSELEPEKLEPPPRIVVRPATDLQVGRLRGEWDRLAVDFARVHHPDLVPAYLEQARTTLARARRSAGDHPSLLAVSGLLEYKAGNLAEARDQLAIAIAGGETRPLVSYTLARLRYDEALAEQGSSVPLTPAQTGVVLAPLEYARQQLPVLPEVYLLLGDLWLNTEMTPGDRYLAVLKEGSRLFPTVPAIVGRAVLLHRLNGRSDDALALVNASLDRSADRTTRAAFERMLARLQNLPTDPSQSLEP